MIDVDLPETNAESVAPDYWHYVLSRQLKLRGTEAIVRISKFCSIFKSRKSKEHCKSMTHS
jgi:hypothetical protein